jgi:hypothetical protein
MGTKAKPTADRSASKAANKPEMPLYSAGKISDDICMVSYLSQSGYTLTVVLNLGTARRLPLLRTRRSGSRRTEALK